MLARRNVCATWAALKSSLFAQAMPGGHTPRQTAGIRDRSARGGRRLGFDQGQSGSYRRASMVMMHSQHNAAITGPNRSVAERLELLALAVAEHVVFDAAKVLERGGAELV